MGKRKKAKVGNPEPITLTGIIAAIGPVIVSIVSKILNWLFGWFFHAARQAVTGVFALLAMTGFHALVAFAPDQAIGMMRKVTNVFRAPPAEWAAFIAEYLQAMTGEMIELEDIVAAPGVLGGRAAIESLGEKFLHPMLNLIMPGATGPVREVGIQPEDGIDAAERFLGTNLEFQMGAWLLHLYGDLMSFGMWKSLKDLPNAISWSYGIGWLSWLVMGVPFRIGISDPLEEYYNDLYRPSRLNLAKTADALNMGLISQETAVNRLRALGWPEELIPIILDMERKKLTKAEATLLYRHDFLSFEDYVETYRERGYTPEESNALATIEAGGSPQDIIQKIADEAFSQYVDFNIAESTLREYLSAALYSETEIELMLALAKLKQTEPPRKEAVPRRLSPANIGQLYKTNKIERSEAVLLLSEVNFYGPQIDLYLSLYAPPEPVEPTEKELSTSIVGGLYKRGEIDDVEAGLLWKKVEWGPYQVMYLLKYYAPPD